MRRDADPETHTKLLGYLNVVATGPTLSVSQNRVLMTNAHHHSRVVTQMLAPERLLLSQSLVLSQR